MRTAQKSMIAKCSAGHVVKGDMDQVYGGWLRCACGREGVAKKLKVTINEKDCSGICTSATGPACSCSCAGENHGMNRVFE